MSAHEKGIEAAEDIFKRLFDKRDAVMDDIIAAYLAALEREGWKLVPTNATAAMQDAGAFSSISFSYGGDTNSFDYVSEEDAAEIYQKMLAAAPSPHDKEGEQ